MFSLAAGLQPAREEPGLLPDDPREEGLVPPAAALDAVVRGRHAPRHALRPLQVDAALDVDHAPRVVVPDEGGRRLRPVGSKWRGPVFLRPPPQPAP